MLNFEEKQHNIGLPSFKLRASTKLYKSVTIDWLCIETIHITESQYTGYVLKRYI